jgi:hypothetical protein
MANCSQTTIADFPGFLGFFWLGGTARCCFLGDYEVFRGPFLPVGVGRVQGTGDRESERWIFCPAVFDFSTFFGIRMFRIGWLLVGFSLEFGEAGREGVSFFAQRNCNSPRKFFGLVCSGSDRLLVGNFGIKLRAKTRRRKELSFDRVFGLEGCMIGALVGAVSGREKNSPGKHVY